MYVGNLYRFTENFFIILTHSEAFVSSLASPAFSSIDLSPYAPRASLDRYKSSAGTSERSFFFLCVSGRILSREVSFSVSNIANNFFCDFF